MVGKQSEFRFHLYCFLNGVFHFSHENPTQAYHCNCLNIKIYSSSYMRKRFGWIFIKWIPTVEICFPIFYTRMVVHKTTKRSPLNIDLSWTFAWSDVIEKDRYSFSLFCLVHYLSLPLCQNSFMFFVAVWMKILLLPALLYFSKFVHIEPIDFVKFLPA